ncbi:hypothetical protein BC833DRAFT_611651 [Globomyces pollinis-pini]|nr:hypothetical protein BC833DRAFT_611651 [Globomyces pollinis-pini]KAJ2987603.1 hypothetical protein HDV02_006044 [Globomyces sp. JEL0801]
MSCVLVGLTAIKVNPNKITLGETIWCVFRDLVLLGWHITLLVFSFQSINDPDFTQCVAQSNIVPWLIFDITVSFFRLLKNPFQYIANRKWDSNGTNWTNPEDLSNSWILYFSPNFTICEMRVSAFIDWLSYTTWLIGTFIIQPISCDDDPKGQFVIDAADKEMFISKIIYLICLVTFLTTYLMHNTSKGRCLPGYQVISEDWPSTCPSISFNKANWRQPGESLADYRQRVVTEFEIMNSPPEPIEMMKVPPNNLTQLELDTLKTITFTKNQLTRALSKKSIVSVDRKPSLVRKKSKTNQTVEIVLNMDEINNSKSLTTINSSNLKDKELEGNSNSKEDMEHPASLEFKLDMNGGNFELPKLTLDSPSLQVESSSQIEDEKIVQSSSVPKQENSNPPNSSDKTTDETCALCIEDYQEGEILRELHCEHRFHSECVDEWLLNVKRTCPICTADAVGQPPIITEGNPVPWLNNTTIQPTPNITTPTTSANNRNFVHTF